MAVEPRRGCGYRKQGGTYLVADGPGFPCGRFPLALIPCPLCDHRPAFTRGLQRITPKNILHASERCALADDLCSRCPLNKALAAETAGLMWVGERFYTPEEFSREAQEQGISKRISAVPKWLMAGKTWVFLAHEKAIEKPCGACGGTGFARQSDQEAAREQGVLFSHGVDESLYPACEPCDGEGTLSTPAVFYVFKPSRIERLIPDTMPEEERARLREQGLTLVEVSHADPDHQPARQRGEEEV